MEFLSSEVLFKAVLTCILLLVLYSVRSLNKSIKSLESVVLRLAENNVPENDLNSRLEALQTMRFSPLRIVPTRERK